MSLIYYLVVKYAIIVRLNIQNTFIASSLSAVCCSLSSKCLNLSGGFRQLRVKHFSHSAHNNHFMWKRKIISTMHGACVHKQPNNLGNIWSLWLLNASAVRGGSVLIFTVLTMHWKCASNVPWVQNKITAFSLNLWAFFLKADFQPAVKKNEHASTVQRKIIF